MHDEEFRRAARAWLAENVSAELRGAGGPGREHEAYRERLAFDRRLAAAGWTCLGWPVEHGGRGATLAQQVAFHEEYARAGAPARVGYLGEELLGPTLIAYGTAEQCRRFLPRIRAVEELWCQGYSEPGAGSDLAAVATRARLVGDEWIVDGQKVWTSLAHVADWCFLLARTGPPGAESRRAGLSYLLVPMRQTGVTVRPIRQLTGTSEFNEVYFDGARTSRDLVVGEVGEGWRVAMGTLAFERGAATLGQQVGFQRELEGLVSLARQLGVAGDPLLRDALARAFIGLWALRAHTLRTMAETDRHGPGQGASAVKLLWARWHRRLGELAMQVRGASGAVARAAPYDLDEWQRLFLFSRADTIYGGSDEIQRGIIAERVLGLPRQARG
ncbi:acyl-CoA dehydrogenase family protein [Micromonospora sp. WMMA1363]|uniref:acyl-CoA dehydrogenase family protein n=1 Tax=Micromonospora sp. WMMA1363 TaxID=3053985 RepID=UPI00259CB92E|nr:acyl-CoA dehydrogenase family protein [Micromonospora sp. WMMA1363]MDM4719407.1 acyl-CoA dehydrogenase family protein [Micromonospora sp. WMMA1363]